MHSRRDQVEAHAFVSNRLKSALVQAEPDAVKVPLRRTPVALACGAMLGALVVGVVAVFSLFKPATSGAWRQPGALVVEKVQQILEDLPAARRSVTTLVFIHGFTVAEAARVLGVPLGTAKSRVFYALRRLRAVDRDELVG